MTIGSLLIELGFKIEGADDAEKAGKMMDNMVGSATKLALGIDVLTTGFGVMIKTAVDAAVGFQKFNLTTGLSEQELQQWQHRAALANVSGQELTAAVEGLAKAKARMAMTGENAGIWRFLGIDQSMDPFQIMAKLQTQLQSLDKTRVAGVQAIMESAGFSANIFQMMRHAPVGDLPGRYIINPQEQQKLEQLNVDWQNFGDLTDRVKNKFSAELSPAIDQFIVLLTKGVDLLSKAVDWLSVHPTAATWIANTIIAVGTLGGLLTGLIATMKLVATGADLMGLSFAPFATGGAVLAGLVATAAAAYEIYKSQAAIIKAYDQMRGHKEGAVGSIQKSFTGGGLGSVVGGGLFGLWAQSAGHVLDDLFPSLGSHFATGGPGVRQTYNTFQNTINIHGDNGHQIGRDLGTTMIGQISGAAAQAQPSGH